MRPKLIILGYARHGKDTVSEILRDEYGFEFTSSSEICCEHVVFPKLKTKYNYKTPDDCFNDRQNHRSEWFNLISDFNKDDPARLGKIIFSKYNIYCGLRNKRELDAMKEQRLFDFSVWVDSEKRGIEREDKSSMTITKEMADYIIDNNGTLDDLRENVKAFTQVAWI